MPECVDRHFVACIILVGCLFLQESWLAAYLMHWYMGLWLSKALLALFTLAVGGNHISLFLSP